MAIKKSLIELMHDEGYGDDLINHLNIALRGKDMTGVKVINQAELAQNSLNSTETPDSRERQKLEADNAEVIQKCSFCTGQLDMESPSNSNPCWRCSLCGVKIMVTNQSYLPTNIYNHYWRVVLNKKIMKSKK